MKLLGLSTLSLFLWHLCHINHVVLGFSSGIRQALFISRSYHKPLYANNVNARTPYFASSSVQDTTKLREESPSSASTSGTTTSGSDVPLQQGRKQQQRRELGSQENLMLPRQYSPNPDVTFPSMNHVSCALLSASPSPAALRSAIGKVMTAHPLLRARIEGDGEPDERIDLLKMVRKGDNHPCTFVVDEEISGRAGGDTTRSNQYSVDDVLKIVDAGNSPADLESSWKQAFLRDLDDGSWCQVESTPLWKVELHRLAPTMMDGGDESTSSTVPSALLLSFNHAISDQNSASRLTDQILTLVADYEESGNGRMMEQRNPKGQRIPPSVEESVLGLGQRFKDIQASGINAGTIRYVAGKALEETKSPVILPDTDGSRGGGLFGALSTIFGKAAGGEDESSTKRTSVLAFRSLSRESTDALLKKCRENGVTVTNALSASLTLTSTDFVDNGKEQPGKERNYKILQSLDMRRFGKALDKGESVGCLAGSMDLMHGPIKDRSGENLRTKPTQQGLDNFWKLAKQGKLQTEAFVASDGPTNAIRVFDFAMTISDLNNLVHLTAQSKDSQGRAYSAGFANAGVYERLDAFEYEGGNGRTPIETRHGKYKIEDIFYAGSNARSGSLYRFSCITVNGEMKFTFHPAAPMVPAETNEKFADALLDLLEVVAGVKAVEVGESSMNPFEILPENSLVVATAAIGAAALLSHAGGYAQFLQSVLEMKNNVEPSEFWPALNFWVFFAVGHPILQPILWISDVLHGSPGPMLGELVPVTFLLGNLAVIWAISNIKEIRNAVNVAALFAFLTYIGAGLDGEAGLGDFNLALDDSYQGKVVKGCPAYAEVRQPSMDNFDLKKYQGLWYEQKFHDWTQFKEVYDTTLDIKLTDGGEGWIDDFAVKGPAPDAAPLSWDKSPVANGAHYFLFGRVDPNDPKGILRESGFGVEFPNYIVDVKKDPQSGEYTEAIQFQCLERGGVRVFEGINFMSRNPLMTDNELTAMHARAEAAGMYPYGASPEQMHTVARRPVDAPPLDNSWQAMWRAIGVDKLLELLTQSIEDGGR